MSLSFDPRLPYLQGSTKVTGPDGKEVEVFPAQHMRDFYETFYLRWRELSEALENAGSGTSYTDEEAQDAVGSILLDTASIAWTYDDATPNISGQVKPKPKGAWIESPQSSEKIVLFYMAYAWPLSEIRACLPSGASTPSVAYSIKYGSDVSAAGTEVKTGGMTVTSTTTGDALSSFDNGTIPAGAFVWLTTGAVSGTVPALSVTLS